jgi:hypothetical protein
MKPTTNIYGVFACILISTLLIAIGGPQLASGGFWITFFGCLFSMFAVGFYLDYREATNQIH